MAFKKGQSGNPRGKKPGTRNKATIAALELLEGDLEDISKVCVEKAKGGDLTACKLILDKIIPRSREGDAPERPGFLGQRSRHHHGAGKNHALLRRP